MNSPSHRARSRRSVLMLAALFSLLLFGCKDAVEGSKAGAGRRQAGFPAQDPRRPQARSHGLPRPGRGRRLLGHLVRPLPHPGPDPRAHLPATSRARGSSSWRRTSARTKPRSAASSRSKPFPYPVLLDPESQVSGNLGVYALPTLMVIDKKGKITLLQVRRRRRPHPAPDPQGRRSGLSGRSTRQAVPFPLRQGSGVRGEVPTAAPPAPRAGSATARRGRCCPRPARSRRRR